jgi:hypothetical protein
MMKFPVTWVSNNIPIKEDVNRIFLELEPIFDRLKEAEDLVFHTMFIGSDHGGPIVVAYGKENDPNIYLDYLDDVTWLTGDHNE